MKLLGMLRQNLVITCFLLPGVTKLDFLTPLPCIHSDRVRSILSLRPSHASLILELWGSEEVADFDRIMAITLDFADSCSNIEVALPYYEIAIYCLRRQAEYGQTRLIRKDVISRLETELGKERAENHLLRWIRSYAEPESDDFIEHRDDLETIELTSLFLKHFPKSGNVPRVLFRKAQAYQNLGLPELAYDTYKFLLNNRFESHDIPHSALENILRVSVSLEHWTDAADALTLYINLYTPSETRHERLFLAAILLNLLAERRNEAKHWKEVLLREYPHSPAVELADTFFKLERENHIREVRFDFEGLFLRDKHDVLTGRTGKD